MDVNDSHRVAFTLQCEDLHVEYGECGSHLLDVTMSMTFEKLEEFIKEYEDERLKIDESRKKLADRLAQIRHDNNMEDSDGEDNV